MRSVVSYGIDLGTSNCALAVARGDEPAEVRGIAQREEAATMVEPAMLPSFLYHPRPDERAALGVEPVVGGWARRAAGRTPGRVSHSAKSWLAHRVVDRARPILPWGSTEVPEAQKVSPVGASAALLRQIWMAVERERATMAKARGFVPEPGLAVTLTVPASFAPDAQELTLEAARQAGLPDQVRLLEEPQAAFYDWLARHGGTAGLREWIGRVGRDGVLHVCVVDVGGGTSDFSLFTASLAGGSGSEDGSLPRLERVAVGEHLLLGGDNVDLAIAHALEAKLGGGLDHRAWSELVAAARDLKEDVLAERAAAGPRTIAVAGAGASLFKSARQLVVEPDEVRALVLDGFFPEVAVDAEPTRAAGGLRELGLPYAADSAITRHLAAFVRGRRVDAVLFNGGTLTPAFLRERLRAQLGAWQGREVVELDNPEPGLAVALGAAWFGAQAARGGALIESRAAHTFWLEAVVRGDEAGGGRGLCLLPRGTPLDEPVRVAPAGLMARVNQPVAFRLYASTRTEGDRAGEVRALGGHGAEVEALPELTTVIQIPPGAPKPANGVLAVELEAVVNAVGLLQVRCRPAAGARATGYPEAWELRFNLRGAGEGGRGEADAGSAAGTAGEARLSAAEAVIERVFGTGEGAEPAAARRLAAAVEAALGRPRAEWSPAELRGLWPALAATLTKRNRSPEHEAAWLGLAGYALRPGHGWPHDEFRIEELWRVRELGLMFPRDARVQVQEWILWRRVAGGLDAARQEGLWRKWEHAVRGKDVAPELIRAAAALERLPQAARQGLAERIGQRLPMVAARQPGQLEAWLWALGRVWSRLSLAGGGEGVLPPAGLGEVVATLGQIKLGAHANAAAAALVQAVRRTGDRALDASPEVQRAAEKLLRKWHATPAQLERVTTRVEPDEAAWQQLAGERLPTGLMLRG